MSTNVEYQFHDLTAEKRGEAAGSLGALKHAVKSWAGLALLVSLGVVGIPFLVYYLVVGAITLARTVGFA